MADIASAETGRVDRRIASAGPSRRADAVSGMTLLVRGLGRIVVDLRDAVSGAGYELRSPISPVPGPAPSSIMPRTATWRRWP